MHKLRFLACFCLAPAASNTFVNGLLTDGMANIIDKNRRQITQPIDCHCEKNLAFA